MPAIVRYFCPPMASPASKMAFDYLKAINQTGVGVRATALGLAAFTPPWDTVAELFNNTLENRYTNIVCSPMGLVMGQTMRSSDVAPPSDPGADDIIYTPPPTFVGLMTVGVSNIAITKPPVGDGVDKQFQEELTALDKYDVVLCPTQQDVDGFKKLGIDARFCPPDTQKLLPVLREFHRP